jgi:glycosyltransferase involved in cell wall biosynthesis
MAESDAPAAARTSRGLRIAYFLDAFPQLSETFVLNEMLELQRQGADIRIYALAKRDQGAMHQDALMLIPRTTYIGEIGRRKKWRGLIYLVLRHPLRLLETFRFVRSRRDAQLEWIFKQTLHLAAELCRSGVNRLHAHFAWEASDYAMLTGMLSGLPYSLTTHAFDIYARPLRLREKMDHATFVVTVCDYNKNYLLGYNRGFPRDRLHVIRVGIDVGRFQQSGRPTAPRAQAVHVVSIARLVEKKGLIHLIEALGILHNEGLSFNATIAGDGPQRAPLEDAVRKWGLTDCVRFAGNVDGDAVRELLWSADLFVLPCVVAENGDRDATPTVLMEAMASGLPVVSTDVGGIPEVVPQNAGILVPQKDAYALAKAIRTIAELGEPARKKMGEEGKRYVAAHLSLEAEVEKLVRLFACR